MVENIQASKPLSYNLIILAGEQFGEIIFTPKEMKRAVQTSNESLPVA